MNPSISLVYLPPHLERSHPFPRVGQQVSSQDSSQEMSWSHPSYSYARSGHNNESEDQQLYPTINRLPGPYSIPFFSSSQYMERESSRSQSNFQSNTHYAHDGLDSSRPLPRRRAREPEMQDSAGGLNGPAAPYANTDATQVDGHHLAYASQTTSAPSSQEMVHASNGTESTLLSSNVHGTRDDVNLMPAPAQSQLSPYSYTPTHTRAASNSSNSTGTSSGSFSSSQSSQPRSSSPATSVVSAHTVSSALSASQGRNNLNVQPSPATARKHKKQRLYNVDRKRICEYHNQNPSAKQEDIARQFKVERSTISKILKNKDKWLHVPTDTSILVARDRPTKFPQIDACLKEWLRECTRNKIILTDAMIRQKALDISKRFGWDNSKFKASSGWVENFKHRWGIRKGTWTNYADQGDDDGMAPRTRANGGNWRAAALQQAAEEAQARRVADLDADEENLHPDIGLPLDDTNGDGYTGSENGDHRAHDGNLAFAPGGWSVESALRPMGPPPDPQTDAHSPSHGIHYSRSITSISYSDSFQSRTTALAPDTRSIYRPVDEEPMWTVRAAIEGLDKVFAFAHKDAVGLITAEQWTTLQDIKEILKRAEDKIQPQALY